MTAGQHDQRIDIGADVIGRDGNKIGTVAYVVVQPPQMHVADFVVSTGAIIGRDVVVPMDSVERVADGKVYLSIDKEALGELKDYVEVHYDAPPEGWVPLGGFGYPTGATLWPAGTYYPQMSSVTVNAPSGTVGLHHGMDVESSDGHKIGSIQSVDEDPDTGDITDLIVKHGLLSGHHLRIPCSAIESTQEGRVRLNLTKDEADRQFEVKSE